MFYFSPWLVLTLISGALLFLLVILRPEVGLALAGGRLYVVHQDGRLKVMSTSTGEMTDESHVPPPAWDGRAVAENRLFLTTQTGELVCLGE